MREYPYIYVTRVTAAAAHSVDTGISRLGSET